MRTRFLRSCVFATWLLVVDAAYAAETPSPLPLVDTLKISGVEVNLKAPPAHLVVRPALGLIANEALDGQLIYRAPSVKDVVLETRATITPNGDYLLMFPEGQHYGGSKGRKVNRLLAYRSSDQGRTWSGPTEAFNINYSQHGFIPLIPRGTKRLYAFGTQPIAGSYDFEHGQQENAPIGFRWSDDDGHTWSDVTLIRPTNDPEFRGMSVMRMCETDSGVWLLGSHASDFSQKPLTTRQYILRSADRGKTWTVLPDAQPNGWFAAGFGRMDEGRPISLGGSKVLFMSRTTQGHLFTAWSDDDGLTWTPPAPSVLVHPDAPPMLFHLTDGKTLVAFHHNRVPLKEDGNLSVKSENMTVRSEIWVSTSTDGGHTWTEPRFLLANAAVPDLENGWRNYQCSYLDAFADHGVLHLFMPHRWQQALHLTIAESALATLPTKSQLAAAAKPKSAKAPPTPNYDGALAAKIEPTREIVYKTVGHTSLHLEVFEPADLQPGDRRPAFVTIHGGGWTSGSPRAMFTWAKHCAELGMVSLSVQYRLYKPGTDVTVFECVKDARSAVRYVRAHAAELGIDPQKIIVNGASAGGHLAAATALFDGVETAGEDTSVSCTPNALVLFSPVIDTSKEGYGNAKVGERWRDLSPAHQVRPGLPPTITFHGTGDTTTPFKGAQLFQTAMLAAGNRSELVSVEGAQHTYMFKDAKLHADTLRQLDAFLRTDGFLPPAHANRP